MCSHTVLIFINWIKFKKIKPFSGEKWEEKKRKKISKCSQLFIQSLGSIEELIKRKFGIIDFSAHVEYMDGLTVPAEFGLVQGSLKTGLDMETDSRYNELILIEPLNKR